jgi:hypothetical protein
MLPRFRLSLFAAAVPALVGSVVIMRGSGVAAPLVAQQILVFLAAGGVLLSIRSRQGPAAAERSASWPALLLVLLLGLPLGFGMPQGPQRWLQFGGSRIHVASLVVPALLLLLGRSVRDACDALWGYVLLAVAAVVLLLQPDAAQTTALACAGVPIAFAGPRARAAGIVLLAGLLACAIAVWQLPDPLEPVPYVEGVFTCAAESGPVALVVAVVVAILPAAMLFWHSRRTGSRWLLSVAIYYLVLVALVPLAVTPVPLLGFGAGPILGYFLMAAIASRAAVSPVS